MRGNPLHKIMLENGVRIPVWGHFVIDYTDPNDLSSGWMYVLKPRNKFGACGVNTS